MRYILRQNLFAELILTGMWGHFFSQKYRSKFTQRTCTISPLKTSCLIITHFLHLTVIYNTLFAKTAAIKSPRKRRVFENNWESFFPLFSTETYFVISHYICLDRSCNEESQYLCCKEIQKIIQEISLNTLPIWGSLHRRPVLQP